MFNVYDTDTEHSSNSCVNGLRTHHIIEWGHINKQLLSTSYPLIADLISALNFSLTPFTPHQDLSISTSLCFAWK